MRKIIARVRNARTGTIRSVQLTIDGNGFKAVDLAIDQYATDIGVTREQLEIVDLELVSLLMHGVNHDPGTSPQVPLRYDQMNPVMFTPATHDPYQGLGWFRVGESLHGVWRFKGGYDRKPLQTIEVSWVKALASLVE